MKTMHLPLGRWLPDKNMSGTFIVLSAVFHFVSTLLHTLSTYIEPLHHAPHLQIALFTTPGNHHLEHRRYLPSSPLAPILDILDTPIAATTCPSACPIYQYLPSPVTQWEPPPYTTAHLALLARHVLHLHWPRHVPCAPHYCHIHARGELGVWELWFCLL